MTSKERVAAVMSFQPPDRTPRFFASFWPGFVAAWRERHPDVGPEEFCGNDMVAVAADETAWPSEAGVVERRANDVIQRTGWGVLERRQSSNGFGEAMRRKVEGRLDPDRLVFDDPLLDSRYVSAARQAGKWENSHYVLCKTGGPYLRAAFVRGEENFWIDVAEDPGWTKAFVDRVTDHITAVGVESLKRFGLQETGIAIYDDVAANWGPFVGPKAYEEIFLPALRRQIAAYREAGASKVMHHADGDVSSLLDMWIDAGVDAVHPLEFRTGLDPVTLRAKYGERLVCIGGLDNAEILPRGDRAEVRAHVEYLMQAGRESGYVMAPHSIGSDVRPEVIELVVETMNVCDPWLMG